ncbi:MAG: hypothetical protein DME54_09995 [Verrucomicrobia bacterium]|nr:MAG: hypothetical protein DME54_09995 [Verrucomicrobiota bacterium]PYL18986.1 MAG: hypothetical protein DMF41_10860 [Verrucomicrobiota bacterium]PYL80025.1 MAG: hypothetical protein DMF21_10650 [Verrucomicrobiota bacterium]
MKTKLLSISILILIGLAQSLEGKDLIKDKSPDGRFAFTHQERRGGLGSGNCGFTSQEAISRP